MDSAFNGRDAIKKVMGKYKERSCECYYKIILMDCNMPVMDGFTACKKLKQMIAD